MATLVEVALPSGWVAMEPEWDLDRTYVGRDGNYTIIKNCDYFAVKTTISYRRSEYETATDLRFDEVANFFRRLVGNAFLLTDPDDSTHNAQAGEGLILQVGGVWRLMKRYGGSSGYVHPITRPNSVVLSAGTLGPLGVVTGISSEGSWAGTYYRPTIFLPGGLKWTRRPDGIIEAMSVMVQEQLEI